LTVDGATVEQSFEVVPDPRVRIDAAGFHTQMQIVARVQADLARVTDALEAAEKAKPAAGSPRAKGEAELTTIGSILASLLTDLEGADGPPTKPQQDLAAESTGRIDQALAEWHRPPRRGRCP